MKLRRSLRKRATQRGNKRRATRGRSTRLEALEPRLLLADNPVVLGQDPENFTIDPVLKIALDLSEPVQGEDARNESTYGLLDLGDERVHVVSRVRDGMLGFKHMHGSV